MKKAFLFIIPLVTVLTLLSPLCFSVAKGEVLEEISLTVIMYHSLLKSRQGVYVLSPDKLRADICGLREKGFYFVSPSELRNYVKGAISLPYKCALVCFDDGHYNNLLYGLPILKEEGVVALISVIGKFCQFSTESGDGHNPNYSYLTWADIRVLQESGFAEIGNHTYAMHDYNPRFGVGRIGGEGDVGYKKALEEDMERLERALSEEGIKRPVAFAYPFGRYNRLAEKVLRERGYQMSFTCCEGINKIGQGNPEGLFLLKRYNRDGRLSSAEFVEKMQGSFMRAMAKEQR